MTARFYRWANIAGIAFVVFFVVGVLISTSPNLKKHDSPAVVAQKVFKVYNSSGDRAGQIIGAYLIVLSALALLWFVVALRGRLVAIGAAAHARLVSWLAGVAASSLVVAALASATVAGSYVFGNQPLPTNADVINVIDNFDAALVAVGFGLSIAALVATVTVVAWRTALLPRWLTYGGVIAVLGGVLGGFFVPLVLVMIWFLGVAIVGLRRPAPDLDRSPAVAVAVVEAATFETSSPVDGTPPVDDRPRPPT